MLGEPLKSERDAAVGAARISSLPPILPRGGGRQDKTRSRSQPGPKRGRQRENKQVWSQAHGALSVPRPAEQG